MNERHDSSQPQAHGHGQRKAAANLVQFAVAAEFACFKCSLIKSRKDSDFLSKPIGGLLDAWESSLPSKERFPKVGMVSKMACLDQNSKAVRGPDPCDWSCSWLDWGLMTENCTLFASCGDAADPQTAWGTWMIDVPAPAHTAAEEPEPMQAHQAGLAAPKELASWQLHYSDPLQTCPKLFQAQAKS